MKTFLLLSLSLLSGCAYTRPIATIQHADGSGETKLSYVVAGGVIRPGVIAVFAEVKGSNSPVILMQASGPPIAPSITGAAGNVAAAATLSGLWPDQSDNVSTVIQDEPRAPMIQPPKMPATPRRPVKSPHDNRAPAHPKGHP